MKLTSSSSKLSSQQQGANTKTTNYPRSLAPRISLISDSESKTKKYARLGNHPDRDITLEATVAPLSWNRSWIEAKLLHIKVQELNENYYTAEKEIIPFERERFYRKERHAAIRWQSLHLRSTPKWLSNSFQ